MTPTNLLREAAEGILCLAATASIVILLIAVLAP
jgi:hypothetical protein